MVVSEESLFLLFAFGPFGFRLKGLENMDKDLDDSEDELELDVEGDSFISAKR